MSVAEVAFYGWLAAYVFAAAYMTFFMVRHILYVGEHADEDERIVEGWREIEHRSGAKGLTTLRTDVAGPLDCGGLPPTGDAA